MYKIIESKLQSNFYRVRVKINENESIFLKFDHYPTIEEINKIIDKIKNEQADGV